MITRLTAHSDQSARHAHALHSMSSFQKFGTPYTTVMSAGVDDQHKELYAAALKQAEAAIRLLATEAENRNIFRGVSLPEGCCAVWLAGCLDETRMERSSEWPGCVFLSGAEISYQIIGTDPTPEVENVYTLPEPGELPDFDRDDFLQEYSSQCLQTSRLYANAVTYLYRLSDQLRHFSLGVDKDLYKNLVKVRDRGVYLMRGYRAVGEHLARSATELCDAGSR